MFPLKAGSHADKRSRPDQLERSIVSDVPKILPLARRYGERRTSNNLKGYVSAHEPLLKIITDNSTQCWNSVGNDAAVSFIWLKSLVFYLSFFHRLWLLWLPILLLIYLSFINFCVCLNVRSQERLPKAKTDKSFSNAPPLLQHVSSHRHALKPISCFHDHCGLKVKACYGLVMSHSDITRYGEPVKWWRKC